MKVYAICKSRLRLGSIPIARTQPSISIMAPVKRGFCYS